jgi:hypothetical protein
MLGIHTSLKIGYGAKIFSPLHPTSVAHQPPWTALPPSAPGGGGAPGHPGCSAGKIYIAGAAVRVAAPQCKLDRANVLLAHKNKNAPATPSNCETWYQQHSDEKLCGDLSPAMPHATVGVGQQIIFDKLLPVAEYAEESSPPIVELPASKELVKKLPALQEIPPVIGLLIQQPLDEDLQMQQGETLVISTSAGTVEARAIKGAAIAQTSFRFDDSDNDNNLASGLQPRFR